MLNQHFVKQEDSYYDNSIYDLCVQTLDIRRCCECYVFFLMNEDVSCNKHPLFSSLIQVAVDLDQGCYGLLLPIDSGFLADKLQPFLAGFAVKTTAVDQGDFQFLYFYERM